MKITDVIIKNFRSIEHAQLNDCGDINILIGKNNAGKSFGSGFWNYNVIGT